MPRLGCKILWLQRSSTWKTNLKSKDEKGSRNVPFDGALANLFVLWWASKWTEKWRLFSGGTGLFEIEKLRVKQNYTGYFGGGQGELE